MVEGQRFDVLLQTCTTNTQHTNLVVYLNASIINIFYLKFCPKFNVVCKFQASQCARRKGRNRKVLLLQGTFLRSLATNWELRTAGVCPEESEVVLAPQLRGHQEPVAPLHLRHFDLGLAQDGRLLVLAEDENSTQ